MTICPSPVSIFTTSLFKFRPLVGPKRTKFETISYKVNKKTSLQQTGVFLIYKLDVPIDKFCELPIKFG